MIQKPSISAVMITLNEELRLPYSIRSVLPWTDEVVVVDMHSTDRTAQIARELGARVYDHDRIEFFDGARALGVEKSGGEWILFIDADELVPRALSRNLVGIATSGAYDVVQIPRLNYLLGEPLLHSGWGPVQDRQPRFFRRGCVSVQEHLHAPMVIEPGARVINPKYAPEQALVHFGWIDFAHCIDKLNSYTSLEAHRAFQEGNSSSQRRAAKEAWKEFFRRFIRAKGYRDGWRGFYLSCFAAMYRVTIQAKLQEFSLGGPEAARSEIRRLAELWLSEYGQEVPRGHNGGHDLPGGRPPADVADLRGDV